MSAESVWNVYILRCADETFYTGICLDLPRRINEHNYHKELGARYTRARRPVTLVYYESVPSRSDAAKREHQIKQLSREQKITLINSQKQL
jgi:putative endonuclease